MKRGLDWYKREPRAVLDSIRAARMTDRQAAVYNCVIDLIYEGGGETPNDPKYISAHFSNVGSAACRRTISDLVEMGKLQVEGYFLTQKRAKNEAKTRENLSETRSESGRKGGVYSGKSRRESKENKHLNEAHASSKTQAEKRREEKSIPLTPIGGNQPDLLNGSEPPPDLKPVDYIAEVVGQELAQEFVDHRKTLKKPLTNLAAKRIKAELEKFTNPAASVNASIMNGWAGVFERDAGTGRGGPGRHQSDGGRALLRHLRAERGTH